MMLGVATQSLKGERRGKGKLDLRVSNSDLNGTLKG